MIKRKEGYNQVVIWPGMTLTKEQAVEFDSLMKDMLGFNIQYLETMETKPDIDSNGVPISNTGGRHDIFFAIHVDDIPKFSLARLQHGMRWIEDVLADCNYRSHIYPDHVYNYVTWNEDAISFPEGVAHAL